MRDLDERPEIDVHDLARRVAGLESRNTRVEAGKAWEVSWTRRSAIAALTYAVVVSYLHVINVPQPWINALVPVFGYLLSTLALGRVKHVWLRRHHACRPTATR